MDGSRRSIRRCTKFSSVATTPRTPRRLADHDMAAIDLICVNLYPSSTRSGPRGRRPRGDRTDRHRRSLNAPLGGEEPRVRHHRHDANQYDRVINELDQHDGATSIELRQARGDDVRRTAEYDATIAAWMSPRRSAIPAVLGSTTRAA